MINILEIKARCADEECPMGPLWGGDNSATGRAGTGALRWRCAKLSTIFDPSLSQRHLFSGSLPTTEVKTCSVVLEAFLALAQIYLPNLVWKDPSSSLRRI